MGQLRQNDVWIPIEALKCKSTDVNFIDNSVEANQIMVDRIYLNVQGEVLTLHIYCKCFLAILSGKTYLRGAVKDLCDPS